MRVRFWGTRGSIPVALDAARVRTKVVRALIAARGQALGNQEQVEAFVDSLPFEMAQTYGGNTSCVQIEPVAPGEHPQEIVICDMGSGVRGLGQNLLARLGSQMQVTFHVFLSHLHWDHIMGLPFFTPAYLPGNSVKFYGCHADMRAALERQQASPSFPVPLSTLGANLEFIQLEPGRSYEIAGMQVSAKRQVHTDDSYGYRFEREGRVVIYSTDSEHKLDNAAEIEEFAAFFREADLVIFDAMYSLADMISVKADWGHSSNMVGVELCQLANARHLVLFHHEPVFSDERIAQVEAETRRLEAITREGRAQLNVTAAYDGLEIQL